MRDLRVNLIRPVTQTNVFDNPLLDEYKQTIWYAAGGGLLAGLVLMFLALWFLRRAPQH
jgi:NhaP-type Na+/H+ or K+/H+ antiporter